MIFNAPATLNIQFKLRGRNKVSVLPGLNLKPDDLTINYLGIKPKKEKDQKEDDDGEISSLQDDQENKDLKDGKIGRPIAFGQNSFLNFKLLAPKAAVHIGQDSTLRGQVLARKVKVEKNSILSRQEVFAKESDPTKIVTDQGVQFFVNEIIILFKNEATQIDIQKVADLVNGKITGIIPAPKIVKIEVQNITAQELSNKINVIKNSNNPLIVEVVQNLIGQ